MNLHDPHMAAARYVADAGGELTGRVRLQSIAYLAQAAGFGDEFRFGARPGGPFSQDLETAMSIAAALGPVLETERRADRGGYYAVYTLRRPLAPSGLRRACFVSHAKGVSSIELDLAATALCLFASHGEGRPWDGARARKPGSAADGRLERAAAAYEALRAIPAPRPLPELPPPTEG